MPKSKDTKKNAQIVSSRISGFDYRRLLMGLKSDKRFHKKSGSINPGRFIEEAIKEKMDKEGY